MKVFQCFELFLMQLCVHFLYTGSSHFMQFIFVQFHFNSSVQSDEYSALLSSFTYNMNSFGDIALILVLFCGYWNCLLVQVKTSALVSLLQSWATLIFVKSFSELTSCHSR